MTLKSCRLWRREAIALFIRSEGSLTTAFTQWNKIKIGQLNKMQKESVLDELRALSSLQHPNIIQFKESFIDELSESLCILMEYWDNGNLKERIFKQKERKVDILIYFCLSLNLLNLKITKFKFQN